MGGRGWAASGGWLTAALRGQRRGGMQHTIELSSSMAEAGEPGSSSESGVGAIGESVLTCSARSVAALRPATLRAAGLGVVCAAPVYREYSQPGATGASSGYEIPTLDM